MPSQWDDTTLFWSNDYNIFVCSSSSKQNTQSEAGQSVNMEYFDNKLNGLITNKYKYKNTLIIIFIIKKKKKGS